MDNTLNLKLKNFQDALNKLQTSLDEPRNDMIRDSAIKRFEFSFELCWKCSKLFLSQKHGIEIFSPKETFRELRNAEILTDKETELAIQMTNDRNLIVHTYNEQFSNELYINIKNDFFAIMNKILKGLS